MFFYFNGGRVLDGNDDRLEVATPYSVGDLAELQFKINTETAERERAPLFNVGEITGDMNFSFEDKETGKNPIDWPLEFMFGKPPKTILSDKTSDLKYGDLEYDRNQIPNYLEQVLLYQ